MTQAPKKRSSNRRQHKRYETELSVDYTSGDTFLFSYITNISEMGIFIRSDTPMPIGSEIRLRFAVDGSDPLDLEGEVVWINPLRDNGDNPNPGMGVRFRRLTPESRERLVELVRTVAYLRGPEELKSAN